METITINNEEYVKKSSLVDGGKKGDKAHSFLKCGEIYSFRTVTMIYVARLVEISEQEFLVEECAWIPETERWSDYLKKGIVKESEPYHSQVILNRGSMLDITLFPKLIKEQK